MWQRVVDADGGLTVDTAALGPLGNNVYLVAVAGRAMVIDPGLESPELVLAALRERGWTLDLILATHRHFDHIAGAGPLAEATGAPIAAHRLEAETMGRPTRPLLIPGMEIPPAPVSRELVEGATVPLGPPVQGSLGAAWPPPGRGNASMPPQASSEAGAPPPGPGVVAFRVLHTPGHTPGSICLYLPERTLLFSGDTLFAGSFGRYDLPGGDPRLLRQSLHRLATLPPETRVLPGHGRETTLGAESWLGDV
jgi:glyoxylase-like metal-dependent hydrolase (beta-lactamase superfamily II)